MKIKKILIPLIPLATTIAPVAVMTSCSIIKDVDYFKIDEAQKTIDISADPYSYTKILIESKGTDLYDLEEVTAVLGETSSKIHIAECSFQATSGSTKSIDVYIAYWCDQSIESETKDQVANFSIKLAGNNWQQKISGFKLIYKRS